MEMLRHWVYGRSAPLRKCSSQFYFIDLQNPGTCHDACSITREGANEALTDGQKFGAGQGVSFSSSLGTTLRSSFISWFSPHGQNPTSCIAETPFLSLVSSFLSSTWFHIHCCCCYCKLSLFTTFWQLVKPVTMPNTISFFLCHSISLALVWVESLLLQHALQAGLAQA